MAGSDLSLPPVRVAVELPVVGFSALGVEAVEMLRQKVVSYAEDIVQDLRLGKTQVELQEAPAENPVFAVAINDQKCRMPFRYVAEASSVTDAATLARRVGQVMHDNREWLVSAEIAQALREAWLSREQRLFLPELSRAGFCEYLRLLVQGCFRCQRHADRDTRSASAQPSRDFDRGNQPSAEMPRKCFEQAVGSLSNLRCILYRSPAARQSTTRQEHVLTEMLGEMQERLFFELGVRFPFVQLTEEASLSEREFRFRINDLRLPAECGLGTDEFLVDMEFRRLKGLGLEGRPARHPGTGAPAAVMSGLGTEEQAKTIGLPVLDREQYIVAACYRELRRHAGVFVVTQGVEHDLELLRFVYPQIVSSIEMHFDVPAIAQVFRNLVAEGVSVRHLRGVLETMLSVKEMELLDLGDKKDKKAFYAYADFLGPAQSGVSAEAVGPIGLAEAVRLALRDDIAYRYARGYTTLPVYRLAKDIESLLVESTKVPLAEEKRLAIGEAVWKGIGKASFPSSVVLTNPSVRRLLKSLIEIELPEVVVLSDEELPPGMKTQTLGHISCQSAM